MILSALDCARFDDLLPGARWELIEDYRQAPASSPAGERRAVEDLLERLCQQVYAVMWRLGFDAHAWALVHHGGAPTCQPDLLGLAHLAQAAMVARLGEMSIGQGWWPIFDHGEPDPFTLGRVATLAQAGAYYARAGGCTICAHPGAPTSRAAAAGATCGATQIRCAPAPGAVVTAAGAARPRPASAR